MFPVSCGKWWTRSQSFWRPAGKKPSFLWPFFLFIFFTGRKWKNFHGANKLITKFYSMTRTFLPFDYQTNFVVLIVSAPTLKKMNHCVVFSLVHTCSNSNGLWTMMLRMWQCFMKWYITPFEPQDLPTNCMNELSKLKFGDLILCFLVKSGFRCLPTSQTRYV